MGYAETRIAELEASRASLEAQRARIVNEDNPETDPRERWIWEENRRSGLLGIDQALAGVEQQLRVFRP